MQFVDFVSLIHPVLAIVFVFPLLGLVARLAWLTRNRRLASQQGEKTKISPLVGPEHLEIGKWLASAVVGITLVALAYSVVYGYQGFVDQHKEGKLAIFQVIFLALMFLLTITSFFFLYKAREKHWRGIFAALTGVGLIVLGCQPGVWRLSAQWYWSHYYIGIAAALLMIISVAVVPEIYQDRSGRWRIIHTVLNCVALLLFLGQGMTGARDLLEIPLSWQKPAIYKCDFQNKTCPGASLPILPLV